MHDRQYRTTAHSRGKGEKSLKKKPFDRRTQPTQQRHVRLPQRRRRRRHAASRSSSRPNSPCGRPRASQLHTHTQPRARHTRRAPPAAHAGRACKLGRQAEAGTTTRPGSRARWTTVHGCVSRAGVVDASSFARGRARDRYRLARRSIDRWIGGTRGPPATGHGVPGHYAPCRSSRGQLGVLQTSKGGKKISPALLPAVGRGISMPSRLSACGSVCTLRRSYDALPA